MKIKFKNDRYKKSRGGYSRLLDISCEHCGKHLFFYQKDGPGVLKRMYIDRISEAGNIKLVTNLICFGCKRVLAVPVVYEKENQLALRLFVGAVTKKIVKSNR